MRMQLRFVVVFALHACIDSPSVALVEQPDASTSSTTAPAPASICDARCTDAGGTCNGDVCTFSCTEAAKCEREIRCPSGIPCEVSCIGKDACLRRVECREAPQCTIVCDGEGACKEDVACTGTACAITCANEGCQDGKVRCCAEQCTVNGEAATCR